MLLIGDEASRDPGQVRMINIAAFDQPDEASMIRILNPQAMLGAAGVARYRPEFDTVV
mgnify:CR=1 FL=1